MSDQDMRFAHGASQGGTELRLFNFHGDEIATLKHNGVPVVAMRRIVENMGLGWGTQFGKLLKQKAKFNCFHIETVADDAKSRKMLCMPIDKLPLWLASINPAKIKNVAIREKVERYQSESAIALHDYWTKGAAIRSDYEGQVTDLNEAVMKRLGGMMKAIVHKELSTILPNMVEAAVAADDRAVATEFRPALAILIDRKVPTKKRRGFSQKVSARLRRYSSMHGHPTRISRETNRFLFHVDAIAGWLKNEGERLIAEHVAAVAGQGVLKLVQPRPSA